MHLHSLVLGLQQQRKEKPRRVHAYLDRFVDLFRHQEVQENKDNNDGEGHNPEKFIPGK